MFKKTGGFTLVELIVVIAILAILAGVAVPAYSGYIKEADKAADYTALNAVQTAVNATYATEGALPSKITVEVPSTVTVEGVDALEGELWDTFEMFYGVKTDEDFKIELKSGTTAVWEKSTSDWTISGTK